MTGDKPLVSIGIPTYNRPELLSQALQSLAKQDYPNTEVVIGDNSDPTISPLVRQICSEYEKEIPNLKYFEHTENKGAFYNFNFVLHQSSGEFFMWMADDYRLVDTNYLSVLVDEIGESTLIFPLFILSNKGESRSREFFRVYESTGSLTEYLEAWCRNGSGYPVYGLYNRQLLLQGSYLDLLDRCRNWIYFNEGLFLHKLFIDNGVKYCPQVRVLVDSSSSNLNATKEEMTRAYCRYSFETAQLFTESNLEESRKNSILDILIEQHSTYFAVLGKNLSKGENKISKLNAYRRLRTAARILLKGR